MLNTVTLFDSIIHDWFLTVRGDTLTSFFMFVTWWGSWMIIVPLAAGISFVLYARGRFTLVRMLWVTLVSAETTTFILKLVVARPRPLGGLVTENDFSFPSGHATIAVAFYGSLALVLLKQTSIPWIKYLIIGLTSSVVVLIGVSRLYLGVHYVSDVVAGYIVGGCALTLGAFLQTYYGNYYKK